MFTFQATTVRYESALLRNVFKRFITVPISPARTGFGNPGLPSAVAWPNATLMPSERVFAARSPGNADRLPRLSA
jgi:hypothetical protein